VPTLLEQILGGYRDTQDRWSIADGEGGRIYLANRRSLHETWLEEALTGIENPPGSQPVAVVLAGGPASGKSSLLRDLVLPSATTTIDSDWFKVRMPEFQWLAGLGEPRAAEVVHEESSDLAGELLGRAIDARHNLVFDQVGNGEPGRFAGKLRRLADAAYRIDVVYADVPVKVAVERDRQRWEESGRRVGEEVVRELHQKVAARFPEVLSDSAAATVRLYDCSADEPRLVFERDANGDTVIHDESRLKAFYAKAQP